MNKTQKAAWINLAGGVMGLAVVGFLAAEILVFKRLPETLIVKLWLPIALLLLMGATFVWLRSTQSAAEVDSDERDKLIQNRAILVAFVSVWILLAAATLIPRWLIGIDGLVPVWVLPFVSVTILLVVMLVYCVSVLIQYGRGGKENG